MEEDKEKLNAVIGFPLTHSLSPVLHKEIYKKINLNARLIKLEDENLENLIKKIKSQNIELIAVTMPFKEEVINYLDEVDEEARKINSVNTVINKNNKLIGFNTDIYGVEKALEGVQIKNKNALIIGAGGVAKTVCYFLQKAEANIFYLNRTRKKAEELKNIFGGKVLSEESLEEKKLDIVINTTPVGMYPNINDTPINKRYLDKNQVIFDIVYNPRKTKLLKEAEEKGVKIISGLDMFIYQGIRQVELWQNNYKSRLTQNKTQIIAGKLIKYLRESV